MKNITFFIFLFVLAIATLFATINPIGISALLNRDTFCYKNIKIKKEKDEDAEQTINNDRINFGDL